MVTNPPVPYDFCVGVVSVLNVKALVGAFNQEKDLVGAFSIIVTTVGSFAALFLNYQTF